MQKRFRHCIATLLGLLLGLGAVAYGGEDRRALPVTGSKRKAVSPGLCAEAESPAATKPRLESLHPVKLGLRVQRYVDRSDQAVIKKMALTWLSKLIELKNRGTLEDDLAEAGFSEEEGRVFYQQLEASRDVLGMVASFEATDPGDSTLFVAKNEVGRIEAIGVIADVPANYVELLVAAPYNSLTNLSKIKGLPSWGYWPRRSGGATAILKDVLRRYTGKRRGGSTLTVSVNALDAAKGFYEKLGFELTHEDDDYPNLMDLRPEVARRWINEDLRRSQAEVRIATGF